MKKLLSTTTLLMLSLIAYAQQNVTRFLGIPVDGTKTEMIRNLEKKGYQYNPSTDILTEEFNGAKTIIFIGTNNNKVCRIILADKYHTDEQSIKLRFNKLCEQFTNNPKYISLQDYTIPEDEDISYEIIVHKKSYQAGFYQLPTTIDSVDIVQKFTKALGSEYTSEQLANPSKELEDEILKLSTEYLLEDCSKRPVWFMISDLYGEYYITMFYDNEYNRANGEDL